MSKERIFDNIEKQLEKFLNKMIPIKYPEVNTIVVVSKPFYSNEYFLDKSNFSYNINVNLTFDGVKRLEKNPDFEDELLKYIENIAEFGTKMFNTTNTKHYVNEVKLFWD
jgi:hypothetical protein